MTDAADATNMNTDFTTGGAVARLGAGTDAGGNTVVPEVDYLAGGWVGIVGPGVSLLVEANPAHPTVRECWRLIRDGAGASRLLRVLDERMDGEVRGFALVTVDGESTHAAARGNSSIRLQERENGSVTLVLGEVAGGGPGRTVDRLYDWPAVTFQLAAGYEAAWPPRDGRPLLPLAAGIVLASAIAGRAPAVGDAANAPDSQRGLGNVAASGVIADAGHDHDHRSMLEPVQELVSERVSNEVAEPEFAAETELEFAAEPEPSVQEEEHEQSTFGVSEFDFEFPSVEKGASLFGDETFFGSPAFTDEAEELESIAGEAEATPMSSTPTLSEETTEQEFGFASAEMAVRPAPEYADEEELFLSGPRTAKLSRERTDSVAHPDFTPTALVPLPANEIDADDPDFAPTMLVPSRPVVQPPIPPAPTPSAPQAPAYSQEQDDPDFAPTMLVPSRPMAMPPTPELESMPESVPEPEIVLEFVPEPERAPVESTYIDPEDPDFAPTMLVPARPLLSPTPTPTPTPTSEPAAPIYGQEQGNPDFAPTMLVPQQNLGGVVPAPVPSAAPAALPADFAPPAGPRYDVGSADAELAPPPTQSGEEGEAAQESDEDMIWKLDWWHSDNSSSSEPSAYGEPFHAQPTPQPQPIQPLRRPHLPAPPPPLQPPVMPSPIVPSPATRSPAPHQDQAPVYQSPPSSMPMYQAPQSPRSPQIPHPPLPDYEDDLSRTVHRPTGHSAPASDASGRPLVPAVRCPAGHLNPPQATHCRVCAIPVPPQESHQIPQPVLGVLRLSTGGDVPLDRDIFLGRDPSSTEDRTARKPHMLRLPSPDKDISRDHLEIRLVGWRVMVIDLGSTNGTTVIVPGGRPEPLAAGGSRMIEPGTQVVLAEEVSLVYEVTT